MEFELVTANGNDTYKFEIKIEDDFRLLKVGDEDAVVSKGMINYWIMKNDKYIAKGNEVDKKSDATQHDNTTLKKLYDNCYERSDKSKSSDFWEEIIIQATGEKINTYRRRD